MKNMKRAGYEADRFQLKVMDLATGTVTDVASTWDRSASSLAWSRDGKSLLVTADDIGKHRLFRIDTKTNTFTPLSTDGHLDAFAETPKGFVFQKSGLSGPAQLYASVPKAKLIDQGAAVLTQVNASLKDKVFGAYEQFSFPFKAVDVTSELRFLAKLVGRFNCFKLDLACKFFYISST